MKRVKSEDVANNVRNIHILLCSGLILVSMKTLQQVLPPHLGGPQIQKINIKTNPRNPVIYVLQTDFLGHTRR